MNCYEMNMNCIKERRRFMHNSLKDVNLSNNTNRIEDITSIQAKDKGVALVLKHLSKEYRLNSIYRPTDEAKMWAEQYKLNNLNNLISMYGLGNGVFARALIEKMGNKDRLLIYEPSADIFFHVMEHYDLTDILSNMQVSIAVENINEFEFHNSLLVHMDINNIRDQIMCTHPLYDMIFPESSIMFWKELKESYYSSKVNINTGIFFGKKFIDNTLDNIKYLHNSYTLSELRNVLPKNVPAMIIAAGPSVANQIEDIKSAKGRAVIFVVDRILEVLLNAGVEPDFVVTLDAKKPVKYFTKRTDVDIPLICFMEANHEILERHRGRKVISDCTTFLRKIYVDAKKMPPATPSSTSVATLTFSVCMELGYKNIILVGQDLAYDGDLSHSGIEVESYGSKKDLLVEDIHGNMVRSRYDWKQFTTWYQDMLIMRPDIHLIDAKEKGAKINGTTVMPLKEVLATYCGNEFDSKLLCTNIPNTFGEKELEQIKEYLEQSLKSFTSIKRKSKEAIKYCDILVTSKDIVNSKLGQEYMKKISKISKFIEKEPVYLLMDKYVVAASAQHILELSVIEDDVQENNRKTFQETKSVLEVVLEAIDYIKPKLKKAIAQVIPQEN